MKIWFFLVLVLAASCSKDACNELQDKLVNGLAITLECSNVQAIKEDLSQLLPSCKANSQEGPACQILMDPIVNLVMDMTVPKKWDCKLTKTKEQLKTALTAICSTI